MSANDLAERQSRRDFEFRLEQSDLIERNAQCLIEILILDVKRHTEQADVAGLELGQKVCRDHISARATQKESERQIEVQIDQSAGVQARDPFLDRVCRGHVFVISHLRKRYTFVFVKG